MQKQFWGHTSEFESNAAAGTPGYTFGFSTLCASAPPPVFVVYVNSVPPVTVWSWEHCSPYTGSFKAYTRVIDDVNDAASDSKAFEVLAPNKISLEKKTPASYIVVLADDGATVSTSGVLVKFRVKRDKTLVGSCAVGIGQENIQQLFPLPPVGQRRYMGWTSTNDQHLNFASPNIKDVKRIGNFPSAAWANEQGVLGIFNQKVRLQYEDCDGVKHWEYDRKTYKATFEKTGPMEITVKFE